MGGTDNVKLSLMDVFTRGDQPMTVENSPLLSSTRSTQHWEPSAPPPPRMNTVDEVRDRYTQLTTKDAINAEMDLLEEQVGSGEINENMYNIFAIMLKNQFENLPSAPPLSDITQESGERASNGHSQSDVSPGTVAVQLSQARHAEHPLTRTLLDSLDFFSGRS